MNENFSLTSILRIIKSTQQSLTEAVSIRNTVNKKYYEAKDEYPIRKSEKEFLKEKLDRIGEKKKAVMAEVDLAWKPYNELREERTRIRNRVRYEGQHDDVQRIKKEMNAAYEHATQRMKDLEKDSIFREFENAKKDYIEAKRVAHDCYENKRALQSGLNFWNDTVRTLDGSLNDVWKRYYRLILEIACVPEKHWGTAKIQYHDNSALTDIYYGWGISERGEEYHGHIIVNNLTGAIVYDRTPEGEHGPQNYV